MVIAGQGMLSETLGSSAEGAGFKSPKLGAWSAHNEVVIDEIRKGRTVPSAGSRAATLCGG